MSRTYPMILAAVILAACGGDGGTARSDSSNMQAASGCANADSSALTLAVLDYISTADPRPQRFLSAAGTDSALPDEGFKVLQDKGPTFFYTGSEEALKKLRDKLEYDGPYASMLVVLKGRQQSPDGMSEQITIAGHYIANQQHGTSSPPRTYSYRCDQGKWVTAEQPANAAR